MLNEVNMNVNVKAQEAIMLMYELTTFVWIWDFIAPDIQIDIGYYNRFNG